jgi:hypothetical protein
MSDPIDFCFELFSLLRRFLDRLFLSKMPCWFRRDERSQIEVANPELLPAAPSSRCRAQEYAWHCVPFTKGASRYRGVLSLGQSASRH